MQLIPRAPQPISKTAVAKYLQLELCPNQPLQILLNSTMSHANNLNASIEKNAKFARSEELQVWPYFFPHGQFNSAFSLAFNNSEGVKHP